MTQLPLTTYTTHTCISDTRLIEPVGKQLIIGMALWAIKSLNITLTTCTNDK